MSGFSVRSYVHACRGLHKTPGGMAAYTPMKKVPFIILADLRTGSTMLSSTLNKHPDIRCLGELFHSYDFADNWICGVDRCEQSGRGLIHYAFESDEYSAVGFRAMVFLPFNDRPQWSDKWDALEDTPDLRVICLERKDYMAQYASYLVAEKTGKFHPSPEDPILHPQNRPVVRIDPDAFRTWRSERRLLFQMRAKQLGKKPQLHITYSDLAGNWPVTINKIQEFLKVLPHPLEPVKQKQEKRRLSEIIENYTELDRIGLV
ncbi:MAG: sulfotransferase [Desulfobacterales bacterium]